MIQKVLRVVDTKHIKNLGPVFSEFLVVGSNYNCMSTVECLALMEGFILGSKAYLALIKCFIGLGGDWLHTLFYKKITYIIFGGGADILIHISPSVVERGQKLSGWL